MLTKWMMTFSAASMAVLGLAASFLPQEIAARAGAGGNGAAVLLVQVLAGLYLGFAILNWSVRDMAIGGIYNRPIVIGNLLHFTSAGLALVRGVTGGDRPAGLIALACLYCVFAVWFGVTMFRSPTRSEGG